MAFPCCPAFPDPSINAFKETHTFLQLISEHGTNAVVECWRHNGTGKLVAAKIYNRETTKGKSNAEGGRQYAHLFLESNPDLPNPQKCYWELTVLAREIPPHPSIVAFLDYYHALPSVECGRHTLREVLCLEVCDLGPLHDGPLLDAFYEYNMPIPELLLWHLIQGLVDGLAWISATGYAHLDLYHNVLLKWDSEEGNLVPNVKIADFDCARHDDTDGWSLRTWDVWDAGEIFVGLVIMDPGRMARDMVLLQFEKFEGERPGIYSQELRDTVKELVSVAKDYGKTALAFKEQITTIVEKKRAELELTSDERMVLSELKQRTMLI
ncbi:hypothetical protein K402DRAFT_425489 [Aulographum hederae CBS 113979]|uniref:Protein kinase domain-containing protein n=1 Tax=Aulographum hederae CBS 113979 TaxID=1176131 RepID=A0A6G1GKR4_9PEZI|nr:hypothetical protein K402DRAFT_425489 [Aulographum hederae CBS 113979]